MGVVENVRHISLSREPVTEMYRPFAQTAAGNLSVVIRTDGEPSYYKVGFRFDADGFGLARARFVAAVRAEGIALDEGFAALHVGRSPDRFRRVGSLAEADRAHVGAVVLHHPVLLGSDEEVEQVAEAAAKVRRWAGRLAAP